MSISNDLRHLNRGQYMTKFLLVIPSLFFALSAFASGEKYVGKYSGVIDHREIEIDVQELQGISTSRHPFLIAKVNFDQVAEVTVILGTNLTDDSFEGLSSEHCDDLSCTSVESLRLKLRRNKKLKKYEAEIDLQAVWYDDGEDDVEKDEPISLNGVIVKKK
jgi:hypothetical protein